ncbi:MAG: potassium-transporting ATPase subunit KdpC [Acidobacteriota bacterium]
MKKHIITSLLYTVVTAVLLGIGYPLVITGIAHVMFPQQASGGLIYDAHGQVIGSKLIGQPFTGATYFHSRPSAAGAGYDAGNSSGSNLGPTNQALITRVDQSVAAVHSTSVPIDLVTTSGSGLDPDITPAAAYFQVSAVAAARHMTESQVHDLVESHVTPRQLGILGEPRVNVLQLNLALDQLHPMK